MSQSFITLDERVAILAIHGQVAEDSVIACVLLINDNFSELDNTCQTRNPANGDTINPKWLQHHQSGHLVKDKKCLVCLEESGSCVVQWRKHGERKHSVMHLDLGAFEPSGDGHQYCLVAAVSLEVDNESKLLPIFVLIPRKDATTTLVAKREP